MSRDNKDIISDKSKEEFTGKNKDDSIEPEALKNFTPDSEEIVKMGMMAMGGMNPLSNPL